MTWMKWIASWFGGATKSLGSPGIGLKAALSGGAPGGWASDHREETAHNTGFNYIAVHAIAAQVAGATVTVFVDGELAPLKRARRKALAAALGTFSRWKSTYGADDRETDPLPASHPLVRLLKRPNPYESGANFRYRQAQQIRLTGTCLIWNVPSLSGQPCERYVIPTAMASPVAPTLDLPRGGWRISPVASRYTPVVDDGFVDCPSWYRILGQILDARQVQVIRLPHAWYLDDGQSPLSAGAKWVDAGEAVDEARFHQLRNGIDPSIVWNLPPDVSPDQDEIDRVQAKISAKYGGPENVGRVIVAQSGTSVTPLSTTPRDMCFTEGFHDFKAAILALHQTPPVAVGLQEPGAYAAYNASIKAWRHAAVQPLCDMLAESDTEYLAPHFGQGLTIEIESDTVDDAELIEQQLQNDLAARSRTRNEWRAVRGMPPLPGPEGNELVGTDHSSASPRANPPSTPIGAGQFPSASNPAQPAPNPFDHARPKSLSVTEDAVRDTTVSDHVSRDFITALNDNSPSPPHDPEIRRRAEFIAEILYGVYGESAIDLLNRDEPADQKAFDPLLHPRDELGRFTTRGSSSAIATARHHLSEVLSGVKYARRDQNVLNALMVLNVRQLEALHREHGVVTPNRLRARLIESILVRLFEMERPFTGAHQQFDTTLDTPAHGVEISVQRPDVLRSILHKSIHHDEWGPLVGAQSGARVYVYPIGPIKNVHTAVVVSVVHPDYVALRTFSRHGIINQQFEVRPESSANGLAGRVLAEQVQSAVDLGFRKLSTFALGRGKKLRSKSESSQREYEGYIVWPKLGFDGPIEPLLEQRRSSGDPALIKTVEDFQSQFPEVKNVSQMMLNEHRRSWWGNFGGELELTFNLDPEDRSFIKLMKRIAGPEGRKKQLSPESRVHQAPSTPVAVHVSDFAGRLDDLNSLRNQAENPDPLTKTQDEILIDYWDQRGLKLGISDFRFTNQE